MTFKFEITTRKLNTYGDKVEREYATTVFAEDMREAFEKLRGAFNSRYNDFRESWSHDFVLHSVSEVQQAPSEVCCSVKCRSECATPASEGEGNEGMEPEDD